MNAHRKSVFGILLLAAAFGAAARDDVDWGRAPDGTFWNGFSKWAMKPPTLAFAPVEGAARYRFVVIDDRHDRWTFEHASPQASLAPVWDKAPSNGFVTVECRALDARGRVCGLAGERRLFKTAPFAGEKAYPPAKRPIERAAAMAFDYVFERIVRDLREQGRPDPKYALNSYPSKMQAAVISALVEYARLRPDRREESLRLARLAADYLISTSEPSGAPLAHLPPTYFGTANEAGRFAGQIMMIYPPDVGLAYLDLHGATEDPKYLQAAERIAATLLRLQGEDGSWYLKLWTKDGSPVAPNRCVPLRHVEFLEALGKLTGRPDYAAAAKRAFDYLDRGPLTDWNWEGQFEDVAPSKPYSNLTKHDACATACYLARRFPKDARRIGQAKALLEFAEDQFVMWERPCRRDGIGPSSDVPEGQRFAGQCDYEHWHVPCVVEQYGYALPVDASSARLIQTYLALNEVAPDPLYVEKARTLANAMTRVQFDSGCIPTIWLCKAPDVTVEGSGWCWRNCHVASAFALLRLCAEGDSAAFVDPAAFGFSPSAAPAENAAALQKALDGGKRRVRVTKPGVYGLDRPVYIDSHTVLEFAPGAVLAKRALYHNVLVNRGAWFGGSNECITVRGLEIRANGFDVNPPPGCAAPGLHGQLAFWKVRDLRVEDYTCNDVGKEQYGIQVVGFDGFTIDGFTIRGRRDGVHLNSGRNFTVRRGVLRTLDDGVALNAGEWPDCTPEMGSLENGVVEQITDEDGGACNFVRVITGRWREWHAGMRLQRCDLVMRGPRVYAIFPHAAGTNETVSLVAPPADHPGRVWTSPEGLNFHLLQTNGVDRADVRNVVIRDCTILGDRGISCMWEHGDYARLVHPDVPAADYPEIDIRVENVVKKTSSPLVHGFASAKIRLENVVTRGPLMQLAGFTQFHPAAFDIEVARCTFAKEEERRAADFFFNGIGSVKLRFAPDVRAERDIDVYRSKKLQGFSLDLPSADIRVRVR